MEADFPKKVSLKMLNQADYISFPDIFTVNLKTIDHLKGKINSICRPFASFKIKILKVHNFGKFDLSLLVV